MLRFILAVSAWCVFTDVALAVIISSHQQVIDFTQPEKAAKLATWSDPEHLGCTKEGFGWEGDTRSSLDGWIETEPLAIGTGWRPARGAGVQIKLQTSYPAIVSSGSGSKTFHTPSIYVRCSADRVHWSDWQPTSVSEDPRAPGSVLHTTRVGVTRRTSREYDTQLQEWSRRAEIHWGSDEDEFCRWLVKRDPDYFAKERPFVGYVQFLLETSFKAGQRLTRFEADVNWAVSGLQQIPKVRAAAERQEKLQGWSFRGVEPAVRRDE